MMEYPSNGSSMDNRWKHLKYSIGILFIAFIVAIGALVKAQMYNDRSLKELNKYTLIKEKAVTPPRPAPPFKERVKPQPEIFTQEFSDGLTMAGLNKDDWVSAQPGSQVLLSYNGEIKNNGNSPIDVDIFFKAKCDEADGRIEFTPCYLQDGRIAKVKQNNNSDMFLRFPPQGVHLRADSLLPGEILQSMPAIGMNGLANQVDKTSAKIDYMLILNGSPNFAFTIPENARPGSDYTIRYTVVRNGKEYLFPHCSRIFVDKEAKPIK